TLFFLRALDVDGHLDLVTDHDAAAVERLAPRDAEVAPVELGDRLRTGADVPHRVLHGRTRAFDVERHFARHAVEREVAGDAVAMVAGLLDLLRTEGHGRVL